MQSQRHRGVPVFLISTVMFLALLPGFSLPAALPLIAAEWNMGPARSGVVMAAFQAGYIIAALVALPLTDRMDTRYVIAGGAAVTACGHLLFPILCSDPISAVFLRALAGAGLGGIYMPGIRLVSMVDSSRGRAVGGYVSSYLLGTAASFGLTGMLLGFTDWRTAYLCVAVAGLAACPVALYVARMPGMAGPTGSERMVRGLQVRKTVFPGTPLRLQLPVVLMIAAYVAHMWELYGLRAWMSPFLAQVLGPPVGAAVSLAATLTSFSVVLSALSDPCPAGCPTASAGCPPPWSLCSSASPVRSPSGGC